MGIEINAATSFLLLTVLLAGAFFVFARVKSDYLNRGRLSRQVASMQVAYFCIYALSSYAFLDARLSQVNTDGVFFPFAIVLMSLGFMMVVLSMPFLGKRSFGGDVGHLKTDGIYRYSRNPQLVGGFLFIAGYALLWPNWEGALWACLWLVISHLMVRAEESHLECIFGDEYRDYCKRTQRYFGLPRK